MSKYFKPVEGKWQIGGNFHQWEIVFRYTPSFLPTLTITKLIVQPVWVNWEFAQQNSSNAALKPADLCGKFTASLTSLLLASASISFSPFN
jgi:hypothetical protein